MYQGLEPNKTAEIYFYSRTLYSFVTVDKYIHLKNSSTSIISKFKFENWTFLPSANLFDNENVVTLNFSEFNVENLHSYFHTTIKRCRCLSGLRPPPSLASSINKPSQHSCLNSSPAVQCYINRSKSHNQAWHTLLQFLLRWH